MSVVFLGHYGLDIGEIWLTTFFWQDVPQEYYLSSTEFTLTDINLNSFFPEGVEELA